MPALLLLLGAAGLIALAVLRAPAAPAPAPAAPAAPADPLVAALASGNPLTIGMAALGQLLAGHATMMAEVEAFGLVRFMLTPIEEAKWQHMKAESERCPDAFDCPAMDPTTHRVLHDYEVHLTGTYDAPGAGQDNFMVRATRWIATGDFSGLTIHGETWVREQGEIPPPPPAGITRAMVDIVAKMEYRGHTLQNMMFNTRAEGLAFAQDLERYQDAVRQVTRSLAPAPVEGPAVVFQDTTTKGA